MPKQLMRIIKSISMSTSKKEAETKISHLQVTISDHLLYLILFGGTRDTKHWLNELSDRLKYIHLVSFIKGGKRLKIESIFDNLYSEVFDSAQGISAQVNDVQEQKQDYTADVKVVSNLTSKKFRQLYLDIVTECLGSNFSRRDIELKLVFLIKKIFGQNLE